MRAKLGPTPANTKRLTEGLWKEAMESGRTKNVQTWMTEGDDGVKLSIICAHEDIGLSIPDWRWHLSIAGESRIPSWDEIAAICHQARPGVPFVLGIPPRSWWLNIHEHCLHCWEPNDPALIDQWRAERRGHTPT